MAKVNINDVENISQSVSNALQNEESNSNGLINSIESMINCDSNKISGEVWEKIKNRQTYIIEALNLTKDVSKQIISGVSTATNGMKDFINPYTMLDQSEKDELDKKIKNIKVLIEENENLINNYYSKNSKHNYDIGALAQENSALSAQLVEFEKKLKKLNDLSIVDAGLYSTLSNEINSSLSKLESYVNNLELSPISGIETQI